MKKVININITVPEVPYWFQCHADSTKVRTVSWYRWFNKNIVESVFGQSDNADFSDVSGIRMEEIDNKTIDQNEPGKDFPPEEPYQIGDELNEGEFYVYEWALDGTRRFTLDFEDIGGDIIATWVGERTTDLPFVENIICVEETYDFRVKLLRKANPIPPDNYTASPEPSVRYNVEFFRFREVTPSPDKPIVWVGANGMDAGYKQKWPEVQNRFGFSLDDLWCYHSSFFQPNPLLTKNT